MKNYNVASAVTVSRESGVTGIVGRLSDLLTKALYFRSQPWTDLFVLSVCGS